jgi:hypothetical protein
LTDGSPTATAAQRADYQEYYTRTLRFLPTAGHDVVIDLQHTVVALLTLAMLAATISFAIRSWPRNRNINDLAAPAAQVG